MQNRKAGIAKRIAAIHEIREAIKIISKLYGGDDPDFLEQYTNEVLNAIGEDVHGALECFRDIRDRAKYIHR